MEQKTDICTLLARWGVWVRKVPTQGVAPGALANDGTGKGDMDSLDDETALMLDKCLLALKAHSPEAYDIVYAKYVYRGTIRKMAEVMKLPKFIVCEQLKIGETFVWGYYEAMLIVKELA